VVTPLILDLLAEAGCSASFFFVGKRAEQYGEIVVETARRGHSVENHTYEHSSTFAFHRPSVLIREIDRTQEVLEKLTGRPPAFFRAPAGIRNMLLHPVLHRRGLSLMSWTRRGFDTVARCPKSVAGRLTRGLTAGDVLLLHDGSSACDRHGEPVVLESLKLTLVELERRGLKGAGVFPAQQNDPGMSSV
jgi:peptidoglycan/xylan/chitin deacetylase (PgdA/CDA1 family)